MIPHSFSLIMARQYPYHTQYINEDDLLSSFAELDIQDCENISQEQEIVSTVSREPELRFDMDTYRVLETLNSGLGQRIANAKKMTDELVADVSGTFYVTISKDNLVRIEPYSLENIVLSWFRRSQEVSNTISRVCKSYQKTHVLNLGYGCLPPPIRQIVQEYVDEESDAIIKMALQEKITEDGGKYVTELDLSNRRLSSKEIVKILKSFKNLQILKLPSKINDSVISELWNLRYLEFLDLSKCRLTEQGFIEIEKIARKLVNLRSINLDHYGNISPVELTEKISRSVKNSIWSVAVSLTITRL